MSNSPESGRDPWPAPWASPSPQGGTLTDGQPAEGQASGAGPDTAATTPMPTASVDAPHQGEAHPGSYPAPPPSQDPYQGPSQDPYIDGGHPPRPPLFANPYGSPAPQQPRPVRDR